MVKPSAVVVARSDQFTGIETAAPSRARKLHGAMQVEPSPLRIQSMKILPLRFGFDEVIPSREGLKAATLRATALVRGE